MKKINEEIKFINNKESGISYIKEMIKDLEKEIKRLKGNNLKKLLLLEQLNQVLCRVER